jgi:TPR repeat protein
LLVAPLSHAATMDEARAALGKRDYATAVPILLQLAKDGSADAQYQLGVIYGRGNAAAPEDHVTAAKYYRMAA